MNTNYHLNKNYFKNPLEIGDIFLYQIGRLFSKGTTTVATHVHGDLYELTVVTDGRGVITTNGVPVKVTRGDIYLSFPCDTHRIESDFEKPLKYDFFAFNTKNESIKNELERIILEYSSAEKRIFKDERVAFLVGNAISELEHERFCSRELLGNIFFQILVYTARSFGISYDPVDNSRVTEAEALSYRMMNYIDTHLYSIKKLEELSAVMGYSYGYLSSVFKKTTSSSLIDYYREKKLEIARLLVLEKRLKIREIAEMLNYTTVYAFSKAYKNRFGASPEGYRNNFLNEQREELELNEIN